MDVALVVGCYCHGCLPSVVETICHWGAPFLDYGRENRYGLGVCVGGALPLNLPEHILKPAPLKLPEGTHQRDSREAEEDLKDPTPERKLKESANVWKM